jgi:hypothetical protein
MGCNWKNNAIKRMIWNIEGCNWKDNLIKRTIKNKKNKIKRMGTESERWQNQRRIKLKKEL